MFSFNWISDEGFVTTLLEVIPKTPDHWGQLIQDIATVYMCGGQEELRGLAPREFLFHSEEGRSWVACNLYHVLGDGVMTKGSGIISFRLGWNDYPSNSNYKKAWTFYIVRDKHTGSPWLIEAKRLTPEEVYELYEGHTFDYPEIYPSFKEAKRAFEEETGESPRFAWVKQKDRGGERAISRGGISRRRKTAV